MREPYATGSAMPTAIGHGDQATYATGTIRPAGGGHIT
jgi:hypothetical protein